MANNKKNIGIIYRVFKTYLRFWHDVVFYKKTYTLNTEAIPSNDTPTLMVSNHQNCLNDPLGILFSFKDRKANFITRADAFAIHPLANKFLRAIGLLPAFRLDVDGEDSLSKNKDTFIITEKELLGGSTIIMFPEAGHQDKRWLGYFSLGYMKLIFETAELGNFEKEIYILPSCNHYSNYFGIQNEFLIKYGTPIAVSQFYELYKTKPRTAQRQLNTLVRKQIEDLMLDIQDLENYEAIDFIRELYRDEFAKNKNMANKNLPDKLLIDREIYLSLEENKQKENDSVQNIYNSAKELSDIVNANKLNVQAIINEPSCINNVLKVCAMILLFPIWIFSLWPALPMYTIPKLFGKSLDNMFAGTFLYALNVLFMIPIFYTLTLILTGIYVGWHFAVIYVLILPFITIFAWYYRKHSLQTIKSIRFAGLKTATKNKISALKTDIFNKLNTLL